MEESEAICQAYGVLVVVDGVLVAAGGVVLVTLVVDEGGGGGGDPLTGQLWLRTVVIHELPAL
jgi:hypothetical protein